MRPRGRKSEKGVLSQLPPWATGFHYQQGALRYCLDSACQLPIQRVKELGYLYNYSL